MDVYLCSINSKADIKSSEFILGISNYKKSKIKEIYCDEITRLINEIYFFDENQDHSGEYANISDIKVLIGEKAYWSGYYEYSHGTNNICEEYIKQLADVVVKASPNTKNMSFNKYIFMNNNNL